MQTRLSLAAKKREGLLAQIGAEVFRGGFQLLDPKVTTPHDPEVYEITLIVEGPEPAVPQLKVNLKALEGVFEVDNVFPENGGGAAAPADLEARLQAAFAAVVDSYPHIATPVQEFASSLDAAVRPAAVFSLGQRVGKREYKKSFSLGSPLKLELALRRMAVLALRPFARAESEGSSVRVLSCPFCINLRAAEPCCDFLAGFLQGLLEANPLTAGVRVKEVRCRACGDPDCTFSCTLERGGMA
ncbi:MAG TPA: 4-vinyl reductase [Thermoanaerobaculia bacterium]|nr:4-vinyl reductase [Thermoanaerobaculia bacterium]